jgi:malonyl-CoA/methylmalonyl-CoA synthetase
MGEAGAASRLAVLASDGRFTHDELRVAAERVASALLDGRRDLDGERVAFLVPPSFAYVATLRGIWRAGGIAVPLCLSHPAPELAYTLSDCGAAQIVAQGEHLATLAPLARACGARLREAPQLLAADARELPSVPAERAALLIYTSGTTGKPKGALTTHTILEAQMRSIVRAWELSERDRILHVLPLHHLHGILNALCAPLYAGGACEILPSFDARETFARISTSRELTVFMAVPTIYAKLAAVCEAAAATDREAFRAGCERLRVMISGSAALPVSMLERFRTLSGHVLLERYGMTEIGMGLGQPLHGERRPGHVGVPFPEVQVRLVDDAGSAVRDGEPGALQVRGPNVFREYWGKPEATAESFTADGWFKTGDVAVLDRGQYRLLGRSSVDILKTGGFKVSALEIEEMLREHPAIAEVCVVGVDDAEWGQRVAAAVVLNAGQALDFDTLRTWAKQRLATYKVPSLLQVVEQLPRNTMGKVQKPEVQRLWGVAADGGGKAPPGTGGYQP